MTEISSEENEFSHDEPFLEEGSSSGHQNIIREKTFNDELKQLLHRISDNENTNTNIHKEITPDSLPSWSKDELLYHFHSLFYRAKFLEDFYTSNTSFNPFILSQTASNTLDNNQILDTMSKQLNLIGFDLFCILTYNTAQKCYTPLMNKIKIINNSNLIIGLNDKIFKEIISSKDGIIIDSDVINNNISYTDSLTLDITQKKGSPIYGICIHNLFHDIFKDFYNDSSFVWGEMQPSPILLIHNSNINETQDVIGVFSELKRTLAVPGNLFSNKLNENYSDLYKDSIFESIQLVSTLFFVKGDSVLFNIKTGENDLKSYFLMQFLLAKLKRTLYGDAAIIQFNANSPFIMSSARSRNRIKDIIDSFNLHFNFLFSINEYNSSDFNNSYDVFRMIIHNNEQ